MNLNRKMGFWTVTSLVAGSQIGTGIFLLPANMAAFGAVGLCSWMITCLGAMLLAMIFASLSTKIQKTGGPHTFVEEAFGQRLGFFAAWTYWVISWLSTPMVVISVISYLSAIFGSFHPLINLGLEIAILTLITSINLFGVRTAGRVEFVFALLKFLPLILLPIAGLFFFNTSHFVPFNPTQDSHLSVLNAAALLTLWGFVGVESATAPAELVENPKKNISRALIVGTFIVALVYIFSSTVIMGVVPREILMQSKAPFADAAQIIFGGNWHIFISITAALVCLSTLNVWMLTSGQIALGAATDGHLPKFFIAKNSYGAPKWGLILSSSCMIPILMMTLKEDLISQVNLIIEISVTTFLFIYILSVLSFIKLFWKNQKTGAFNIRGILLGMSALAFCGWALYSSGIKMVLLASLIPLAGLPVYLWKNKTEFAAMSTKVS